MSKNVNLPNVDPQFYESMLSRWRENPDAVDAGWRDLFAALGETPGARPADRVNLPAGKDQPLSNGGSDQAALALRRIYRERGHLYADSDPLNRKSGPADLAGELADFGLDMSVTGRDGSLDRLTGELERTYCGTLSAEFMHIDDREVRTWFADAMENGFGVPDDAQRLEILDQLVAAETFEDVMQTKLPTVKRFGMEGSETQMPLCERLLERAAACGVEEVVLGPMHRGRTTFMALFMEKPATAIFSEFQGTPWAPDGLDVAGDVTYHMGWSTDRRVADRTVHISMASHPSHVETVIPVSLGKARARRDALGEGRAGSVLGLMMHTDAGFAGQGIVAECFQLSGLDGYETGGSIHVIANNQVGFTTRDSDARTSRYCSDMGKIVQAPVLRVNGDDPEAGFRAASIAVAFWDRFRRDIIIDLVCYRRRGHNELDEPRYTQPAMYRAIDALPGVVDIYAGRLAAKSLVTPDRVADLRDRHRAQFDASFDAAAGYRPNKQARFERHWSGYRYQNLEEVTEQPATGVPVPVLKKLNAAQVRWPDGFRANGRLRKQLEDRADAVGKRHEVSWASAETLALASLLAEGTPVRLTGEDTRRGTFSQRHGIVLDETTEIPFVPLNHVAADQAAFHIHDSPLSEAAVLGFEYGYSLADPETLVIWEAQFGDFANVAQPIIDQYVAPGEEKWLRSSGLVMLLPHGLEGGGPEHSSARLERFLHLCARGNMHVVNCTTPANHFHALRRQMRRDYRKPLIAMTPKLMLRHKAAVSPLKDLGKGTRFQPVISDEGSADDAKRVILCSGRVYFQLDAFRRERKRDDVSLVRLEELYPFPSDLLSECVKRYKTAKFVWCQEEPENMGAWHHVEPRIRRALENAGVADPRPALVSRPANPSPAPGFKRTYDSQQSTLLEQAFGCRP